MTALRVNKLHPAQLPAAMVSRYPIIQLVTYVVRMEVVVVRCNKMQGSLLVPTIIQMQEQAH